jgi:hypothetical protein
MHSAETRYCFSSRSTGSIRMEGKFSRSMTAPNFMIPEHMMTPGMVVGQRSADGGLGRNGDALRRASIQWHSAWADAIMEGVMIATGFGGWNG